MNVTPKMKILRKKWVPMVKSDKNTQTLLDPNWLILENIYKRFSF